MGEGGGNDRRRELRGEGDESKKEFYTPIKSESSFLHEKSNETTMHFIIDERAGMEWG